MRAASVITGLAVGVGVSIYHGVLQFGYMRQWSPAQHAAVFAPTMAAAVASSTLCTIALFRLFLDVSMHPLLGALAGAGVGFLEGAVIGGATYGTFFGVACALHPEFMNRPTWWHQVAGGAFGAAVFGSLIGLGPGAVAALVLTLVRRSS